jgi:hypothetical protein
VVFVIANLKTGLLDLALDTLKAKAQEVSREEAIVQAYVAWINSDRHASASALSSLASAASMKQGAGRTYRDVAVLGFATSVSPTEENIHTPFLEGLRWMEGRRFFASNGPLSFEVDGLSILGIAVGIAKLDAADDKGRAQQWLLDLINKSLQQIYGGKWDRSLLRAARIFLNGHDEGVPHDPEIDADLWVALEGKGIVGISEEAERAAGDLILDPENRVEGIDRNATRLFALRWLMRQAATAIPTHATIDDVVKILKAVPNALRRWTWEPKPRTKKAGAKAITWDMQNEYHVQSLLWAILAPIFPDLEDEENLPSFGHKHPRCDLAIPSLRLIVEVKFIYKGTHSEFAAIVEGLAADANLYLADSANYSRMIAFVWDNSRRTEHHAELLQGLRKIPGIVDTAIVLRPGGWTK